MKTYEQQEKTNIESSTLNKDHMKQKQKEFISSQMTFILEYLKNFLDTCRQIGQLCGKINFLRSHHA